MHVNNDNLFKTATYINAFLALHFPGRTVAMFDDYFEPQLDCFVSEWINKQCGDIPGFEPIKPIKEDSSWKTVLLFFEGDEQCKLGHAIFQRVYQRQTPYGKPTYYFWDGKLMEGFLETRSNMKELDLSIGCGFFRTKQ